MVCILGSCGTRTAVEDQVAAGPVMSLADSLAAALAAINQRIVEDPGNAAGYADRAGYYMKLDSTNRAAKDMDRALALDSTNLEYRLRAGDLRYAMLELGTARVQYSAAMRIAPEDTRARLKLAEIDLVLRKYPESMALVNEALRLDPTAAHGYYLKGWIYKETKDTLLAISSFRTAVEQDPQDYNAYMMLGSLSAAKNDPLAMQYFGTATELRPTSIEAIYSLAMYCQDAGKDSIALACYDRMKEIDPSNALAWYNSGWVYLEHKGDIARAKVEFSKAIALQTNYADAWYNRGVAMERTDELDSAAANYQLCLSIRPDHDLAANGLDRLEKRGVRIKMRERKK
ncbi:MAG: tetratricopeptide repeat protein [Flavobacteriales bacterium]|nr:tetratricopeptide repeat protein [Flavobacteriales bacterium]